MKFIHHVILWTTIAAAVVVGVLLFNGHVKIHAGPRFKITLHSPSAPPLASNRLSLVYEPSPQEFWAFNHAEIYRVFQNGQCTQLAADRRFDIVQAIVRGYISRELAAHQSESVPTMDARNWPAEARYTGVPTGNRPRARALVVFQPGVMGAGAPYGHIAYVTKVGKRFYWVAEMHAPVLYHVTRRRLANRPHAGVTFIY